MGILLVSLTLLLFSTISETRPISYPGGSTVMAFTDNLKDSLYYHYSPSYRYSIGLESLKHKVLDQDYSYVRFTYLLNRKNTQNSQRNLYFQSGVSLNGVNNHFYGVHGDWETRRWFSGFGYKQERREIEDYSEQVVQLGLAPYLGEYGDFHTWIMIKTKKNSLSGSWSTYPLLKCFKGDFLIEFGYNDKTKLDAHLMYRF